MGNNQGGFRSAEEQKSTKWKQWWTVLDWKACYPCVNMHGKIWDYREILETEPPIHWYCRCEIDAVKAVEAGKATKDSMSGADWYLKYYGRLPDYYISTKDIAALGWKRGSYPYKFAPGKMIAKGEYQNRNGHLPSRTGRQWYEADINYTRGKRNSHRVVWTNDGLIFVTYDHYQTFVEIV